MSGVYVLWLRQVKRYFRSRARMLGSLGQPILFLLALGFGLGPIYERAGGGSYIQFLAPGVIAMSILFTAIFSGIELIWDKQFGFLKETLVAPVSRLQIMLGRTLGGATTAIFQGIVVLLITVLIGFRPVSLFALIPALITMFLIAMLFTALGTGIASLLNDMQAFPLVINFLVMPLFFLSGSLFPLEGLSKTLTFITRINPLTYGVDALRATLTGVGHFNILLSFSIVSIVALCFLGIGSYLFSRIQI